MMKANIHSNIARLILEVRAQFDIDHFVETGTNVGETAEWASDHFDRVTTIEMDDHLYSNAVNQRGHIENIKFVRGKSQDQLQHIVPELDSSAVFHFDAHCGGKWRSSAGDLSVKSKLPECPLLDELDALSLSDHDHFVFIDDARVFASPRREPFDMDDWPTIQEIIHKVEDLNEDNHVIIYKDAIIVVPPFAKDFVRQRVRSYKTDSKAQSTRFMSYLVNKVWKHATLSGPTRDF